MKILIAIFLFLGVATHSFALGGEASQDRYQRGNADGILQSIKNATITQTGESLLVTRRDSGGQLEMVFTRCQGLGVQYDRSQWWVLPISATGAEIAPNRALWVLPLDAVSKENSWYLELHGGGLHAKKTESGLTITVDAESITLSKSGGAAPQRSFRS